MKTNEGLWKLSPSGLYTYEDCPACFWVEQHAGRAPSIPMRLNDAMDEKLKSRYDKFRKIKKLPPEISKLKDISLFDDLEILNSWRNTYTVLSYINKKDGYILQGRLDEVFVTSNKEYIPVDFKSSGDPPKEDKKKYYILQLHAYALILREKGYKPANKAYLIHYFTKDRKDPSTTMEFSCSLDEVSIDLPGFEKILKEMVVFLNQNFPGAKHTCDRCLWQKRREDVIK